MPTLDDIIKKNQRLLKELVEVTEKLTKNEQLLKAVKGDEDND